MNFVFHFISGRMLSPTEYGTLTAVMAITYLFNVPGDSIQTIISRYSTRFFRNKKLLKRILVRGLRKFLILSIMAFILFALVSPFVSYLLKTDYIILAMVGVLMIIWFLLSVNRGMLQGLKRFSFLGINYVSEGFFKLLIMILLIVFGFGLYGAVSGLLLGIIIAFVFSFFLLGDVLKEKTAKRLHIGEIKAYSLPVLVSFISITVFYSIDLILAKIFFPTIAGEYASISMLSKILYFGSLPISKVMFPLSSDKETRISSKILKKALLLTGMLCLAGLIVYILIPGFIVNLFYGSKYLSMAGLLFLPSIAMFLLSFSNIFVLYNLSNKRYNINYFVIFFAVLQIVLMSIFNKSILQFIYAYIASSALLLISLIVFQIANKGDK
jgi:O-antigen/teichoic acid export membrane protein